MPAQLWEWTVDRGIGSTPTGVCGARHRAMAALSRSLVKACGPASGRVLPMALVDGAFGFAYQREPSVFTADCEKGVITWTGTGGRPQHRKRPAPCETAP